MTTSIYFMKLKDKYLEIEIKVKYIHSKSFAFFLTGTCLPVFLKFSEADY